MALTLSLLLLAGALVGHAALMTAWHNWFYGLALPRPTSPFVHGVFGLATVAGPALWLWFVGPDMLAFLQGADWTSWRQWLLTVYLGLCWFAGLVVLPWETVRRLVRRPSAVEESVRARVLDVAKKLGYTPLGRGKISRLAQLPGNQICKLEMVERTLRLPRLPPGLNGLTILHLSDLHLCGTPDRHYYRVVMQECATWEPDLVCITGDIVDSFHHQGWIVPALSWMRWRIGAFAIFGNHDYWYDPPFVRRRLARLGITYLGNSWQEIEARGEKLLIVGQENPWLRPGPDLSDCPPEPFRICLSHTPDNIEWARRNRMDLMLAGHVHGGQIRFPVVGSVLVPSRYGRRYDCGTFHEPPTFLHVSRGIGGEKPLRYGCLPEATLLRLVS